MVKNTLLSMYIKKNLLLIVSIKFHQRDSAIEKKTIYILKAIKCIQRMTMFSSENKIKMKYVKHITC